MFYTLLIICTRACKIKRQGPFKKSNSVFCARLILGSLFSRYKSLIVTIKIRFGSISGDQGHFISCRLAGWWQEKGLAWVLDLVREGELAEGRRLETQARQAVQSVGVQASVGRTSEM